jgi:uncharacterized protein YqeY
MLIDQIRTDLNEATKAREKMRQRTLRSIIAAVQEASVSGTEAKELDDDGVLAVIKAQVKRRIDAAEAFEAGGRAESAAEERSEMKVLEEYLPAAMSNEDLESIVASVMEANGFETRADMGNAMKAVNAEVDGRADGRRVAELVKSKLS